MKNLVEEQTLILAHAGKSTFGEPVYEVNGSGKYVVDLGGENYLSDLHWLSPSTDIKGEPGSNFKLDDIRKIKVISNESYELPKNIQRFAFEFNGDNEGLLVFEKALQSKAEAESIMIKQSFEKYASEVSDKEKLKDFLLRASSFRYQLLDRLKMDCDYYLGYGNRYSDHLYFKSEKEHVTYMKALWESFPKDEKPEWLTWENISEYENQMIQEKTSLNGQIHAATARVEGVEPKQINNAKQSPKSR